MSDLIPWLFLIPPGLVTLLALGAIVHGRSAAGQALKSLRAGGVHLYKEEWDEAEAAFAEGLKYKPEHPALLGSMASFLVARERYEESEAWIKKAMAASPSDLRLKMAEGKRQLGLENAEEAMEIWTAIPEDSDVYIDAQGLMAQQQESQGNLVEAMAHLERAIKKGTVHQVRPHKKELRRLKKL